MLAIVLRIFILLELSLYVTVALRFFDASSIGAALFSVACLIGFRLLITTLTFLFAWQYRSPFPHLSVGQAIGLYLGECAAFVANFVFISPVERWWMGADRLSANAKRPPLLLIHGYGCSRAAWWWHRRRLEADGWPVATLNLEPIYTSIESYVDAVAQRVDQVLAATGAPQVILVGHSMGGLVARAYLRRHGAGKVLRLVTLGTPHGGSELARLGFGENARQMRAGSDWLSALANEQLVVDTLAIYSRHDNYVMPQRNLELTGASVLTTNGVGHLAMLYSPRVAKALQDGLSSAAELRSK